jgi:hypothetical protein
MKSTKYASSLALFALSCSVILFVFKPKPVELNTAQIDSEITVFVWSE